VCGSVHRLTLNTHTSIGFAIPLRQLFAAAVVWKGWAYASLMALAKLLAAVWLFAAALLERRVAPASERTHDAPLALERRADSGSSAAPAAPERLREPSLWQANWRAALLLGLSLVARGEIGFIILNNARGERRAVLLCNRDLAAQVLTWTVVAADAGILSTDGSDARGAEAFNVGVWAIGASCSATSHRPLQRLTLIPPRSAEHAGRPAGRRLPPLGAARCACAAEWPLGLCAMSCCIRSITICRSI